MGLATSQSSKVKTSLVFSLIAFFLFSSKSTAEFVNVCKQGTNRSVQVLASTIKSTNASIENSEASRIAKSVLGLQKKIPPSIILALIEHESAFNPNAVSSSGAIGLMQIIPKWHTDKIHDLKRVTGSSNIFTIENNILLGYAVLEQCLSRTRNLNKALTCYNGGEQKNYSEMVMQKAKKYEIALNKARNTKYDRF